jgi:hypothetical protein
MVGSQSEVRTRWSMISILSDDKDNHNCPGSDNYVTHICNVTATSEVLHILSGPPIVIEGTEQDFYDIKKQAFFCDYIYGTQHITLTMFCKTMFKLVLWPVMCPTSLGFVMPQTLACKRNVLTSLNTIKVYTNG